MSGEECNYRTDITISQYCDGNGDIMNFVVEQKTERDLRSCARKANYACHSESFGSVSNKQPN